MLQGSVGKHASLAGLHYGCPCRYEGLNRSHENHGESFNGLFQPSLDIETDRISAVLRRVKISPSLRGGRLQQQPPDGNIPGLLFFFSIFSLKWKLLILGSS